MRSTLAFWAATEVDKHHGGSGGHHCAHLVAQDSEMDHSVIRLGQRYRKPFASTGHGVRIPLRAISLPWDIRPPLPVPAEIGPVAGGALEGKGIPEKQVHGAVRIIEAVNKCFQNQQGSRILWPLWAIAKQGALFVRIQGDTLLRTSTIRATQFRQCRLQCRFEPSAIVEFPPSYSSMKMGQGNESLLRSTGSAFCTDDPMA